MEIIWNIQDIWTKTPSVVTLGTFDGVHLGHQAILKEIIRKARQTDARATLITFEPHPQLVLQKPEQSTLRLLTTIEEKIRILSTTGLDCLIIANFSPAFAGLMPEEFVERFLLQKLLMREILVGHDHAFGNKRSGNIALLKKISVTGSFAVSSIPPVEMNGEILSSTKIRSLLQDGEIEKSNVFLGRPYSFIGQVFRGDGRGRQLGYPTINVRPHSQYKLVPKSGIYATRVQHDHRTFDSVTYIGSRPTFQNSDRVIETHIFDFDQELYGSEVQIDFLHYIRDDFKFESVDALVHQMKMDSEKSLELLKR